MSLVNLARAECYKQSEVHGAHSPTCLVTQDSGGLNGLLLERDDADTIDQLVSFSIVLFYLEASVISLLLRILR